MSSKTVVAGDGWAALGAVGCLLKAGLDVIWLAGTGSRLIPALPTLEMEGGLKGADAWLRLAQAFDLQPGEVQTGSFLREFRNKAFREPNWIKAPTPEMRRDVHDELLWGPEQVLCPLFEGRFQMTVSEIENAIREKLLSGEFKKKLKRIEGVPFTGIRVNDQGRIQALVLGSGQEIPCDRLIYADRWSALSQIENMPKGLPFTRKREPAGVLQAMFVHDNAVGAGLSEGFFGILNKDAGEDIERNVWGYFSSDGTRSTWTLCLSPDEVEDNHTIAKKLRRMKNALDKMFAGASWLPEGKSDFMANVKSEQVRFEESVLFTEGQAVTEPQEVKSLDGVSFLTDGYGPSQALAQVAYLFPELLSVGAQEEGANPQAENVNLEGSAPA